MHTPVLIIGSGLAGMAAAYRLSKFGIDCTIVTKDASLIHGSNSELAQGGIIYRPQDDTPSALVRDIMYAGDQINFETAVRKLAMDGIPLVKKILIDAANVPFDPPSLEELRRTGSSFSFTKEAAHDRARIIHVKDQTGQSIMEHLSIIVRRSKHVRFLKNHILVDLLTSGHNCRGYEMKYYRNRCLGAFLYNAQTGKVKKTLSDFTILATGGVGQVYKYHTNNEHAFGSGIAAANRARVRIINARFVQFHPTALFSHQSGRRFLISESLRGEGARLMNLHGKYFMNRFPLKDLESRAVVSRAIMEEMKKTGSDHVYLNLADFYQGSVSIQKRFPGIYAECKKYGIDIEQEPIPVVPAAHFFCGGIAVDLHGQSELPGLFAAGEVACTGVHGSNRLASTSLLEALSWGVFSADEIHRQFSKVKKDIVLKKAFSLVEDWQSFGSKRADSKKIAKEKKNIRNIMWEKVGIIRTQKGLFEAKDTLRKIWKSIEEEYSSYMLSEDLIELRHMIEAAWVITNSASSHTNLMKDSLGGHVLVTSCWLLVAGLLWIY